MAFAAVVRQIARVLKAAIRALSDLSGQAGIAEAISEIEINPLTVTDRGILALDALIVLRVEEAR